MRLEIDLTLTPVGPLMTCPPTVSPPRSSMIAAHPERELKLSVDDAFRLPRLPGTLLPRRLLLSTYYDTAAYDLAHARITLRRRIERGKKTWQLKLPLNQDRLEVEVRCWNLLAISMSRSPIFWRSRPKLGARDRTILEPFLSYLRAQRNAAQ